MLMLLTGGQVDAEEALRIGLISRVVPSESLMAEARGIARLIAANAPLSVAAIKRLVYSGLNMTLEAGVEKERMTWGLLRDTEDRIEGRVAFREKRPPVYRGR
jgi:E-phenylitaconyl-CoA hydratase